MTWFGEDGKLYESGQGCRGRASPVPIAMAREGAWSSDCFWTCPLSSPAGAEQGHPSHSDLTDGQRRPSPILHIWKEVLHNRSEVWQCETEEIDGTELCFVGYMPVTPTHAWAPSTAGSCRKCWYAAGRAGRGGSYPLAKQLRPLKS